MNPKPHIVAVSRSAEHGFSKQPQASLHLVEGQGVEGDAHRGTTTQHLHLKRRDPDMPNLAQVHLFAAEMLDELRAAGFALQPGEIGENILTREVDLLFLPQHARLHLGADVVLEVTGLRTPCSQIDRHQRGLQEKLWGPRAAGGQRSRRAGVMSIVCRGGTIHAGDVIHVELPPLPHLPLGPV